jgi:hypothetical protein
MTETMNEIMNEIMPEIITETYQILDNGDMPFKVEITTLHNAPFGKKVKIYKKIGNTLEYDIIYGNEPFIEFEPERVFIGKSTRNPQTNFSGGFGEQFDGNTILLHLNDNLYLSIGSEIYTFTTDLGHTIIEYVSPVGNSSVPYPYAVDDHENFYLMIENVVVKNIPMKYQQNDDQYGYYYDSNLITLDMGRIPPRIPKIQNYRGIKTYYHGNNNPVQYTLRYTPIPDKNYDRLSTFDDFDDGMFIEYVNGDRKQLSKADYITLMENFGTLMGFKPISNKVVVHPRIW